MRIRLLLFGQLKDICGQAQADLDVEAGAVLGDVFDLYASRFPKLLGLAPSIVLAHNQEFAARTAALAEGDEIAFLPPVSGGSDPREIQDAAGHYFALTRSPIETRSLEERVLQGIDGAIVTFQGVVRNNTRGRVTLRLDYECYEPMALAKMAEIGRAIATEFPVSRVAIVHRLGLMEIGEASVVVVVASPHRRAAFDAALAGINRLKELVPVWKKEYFADGAVWVEGDWADHVPKASG